MVLKVIFFVVFYLAFDQKITLIAALKSFHSLATRRYQVSQEASRLSLQTLTEQRLNSLKQRQEYFFVRFNLRTILLKIGFDQTTPNENLDIGSWMTDKVAKVGLEFRYKRAYSIKCYVPEYTFMEKLQAISTKFRKEQSTGNMPVNFMRHYYNNSQLVKLQRVQEFIGTKEYNIQ